MKRSEMSVERLQSFSDGVFAVIITILVLDLRSPERATWSSLAMLWPTALGYAVSYLFVAIAWLNHHHLLQHAKNATSKLVWANFAHLFTVSLVPFVTSWMSTTRLGAVPVFLYAVAFVFVNMSYIALCMEAVDRSDGKFISEHIKGTMRMRSVVTLLVFLFGGILALWYPVLGFSMVTLCLMSYLRPGAGMSAAQTEE
jgi:uncharacterized membrane protein